MRADSLAKKLVGKDTKAFWKEVKTIHNNKPSFPGISGVNLIVDHWQQHHSKLFTCVQSEPYQVDNVDFVETIRTHEVYQAIKRLSANKSTGMDLISAEHLKFASSRLVPLLALCFTGFVVHGFIPDSFMKVLLSPVIKDKAGKVGSSDNYRPNALASTLSKIFELILLPRFEKTSTDNQFGFKSKHGTDLCIYGLKEVLSNYNSKNSTIFLFLRCHKGL